MIKKKSFALGASIICSDFLNLKNDIKLVVKGGADFIHFDVMDGVFVPRYGLPPEILKSIKSICKIPVDVHMMVDNPELYIESFAKAGAEYICVHAESCKHLHRTIQLIKSFGIKAGVALNPATPLNVLDYVLQDISMVVLMAINPGIVGHKLIPSMFEKVIDLRNKIDGYKGILIEIDGGVTFETSSQFIKSGADVLVCGSSTIFSQQKPIDYQIKKLKSEIFKSI